MVRREFTSLRVEKTIILAIAIQLVIAGFSSFLVVGLVSLYAPAADGNLNIEVAITGEDTDALLQAALDQDGLDPELFHDEVTASEHFQDGSVAAILRGERDDDGRLLVEVTAPDEGLSTTLLLVQVRDALESLERSERLANDHRLNQEPLTLPADPDPSPYVTFTYTILIPLLLFLPVFISGSIAVDSLLEERERGTLELLQVAPPGLADVLDAKLLAATVLAPVQALCWLGLLAANGIAIARPGALVAAVTAISLLVVSLGLVIALVAPDRRQGQLLFSGGIVSLLVVGALLPEHPANTIAKFAIGAETTRSWLLLAGFCVVGVLAVYALRHSATRIDLTAGGSGDPPDPDRRLRS